MCLNWDLFSFSYQFLPSAVNAQLFECVFEENAIFSNLISYIVKCQKVFVRDVVKFPSWHSFITLL